MRRTLLLLNFIFTLLILPATLSAEENNIPTTFQIAFFNTDDINIMLNQSLFENISIEEQESINKDIELLLSCLKELRFNAYEISTKYIKELDVTIHCYPFRTIPLIIIDQNNKLNAEQFSQIAIKEKVKTIVNPYNKYGYVEMQHDLQILTKKYPFIKIESIGKSVEGRDLLIVKLGIGPKEVYYSGAMHPEEWITGPLLMKFIEDYAKSYCEGTTLYGYSTETLFEQTSIYIQPITNPDGVELTTKGITPNNPYYNSVMEMNKWSNDFSRWRSNINGVNINCNFPAYWDEVSNMFEKQPSGYQFPGYAPLSEPESKAMVDFTLKHNIKLVLCFHTQGQIIYWTFYDNEPPEAKSIVQTLSSITGYTPAVVKVGGGYRDWFVQTYHRPGFTIEVGKGENPLPISQFDTIWNQNVLLMLYVAGDI